jgi:hypothetical protein
MVLLYPQKLDSEEGKGEGRRREGGEVRERKEKKGEGRTKEGAGREEKGVEGRKRKDCPWIAL